MMILTLSFQVEFCIIPQLDKELSEKMQVTNLLLTKFKVNPPNNFIKDQHNTSYIFMSWYSYLVICPNIFKYSK